MSPPWMPLWIGDYLKDTNRLSTLEHGAYLLLIMEYWTHGGLPVDDRALARIARLTDRDWREVRPSLERFFQPGWKHSRVDRELVEAAEAYERRAEAGRKGAAARHGARGNVTSIASSNRTSKRNGNGGSNA